MSEEITEENSNPASTPRHSLTVDSGLFILIYFIADFCKIMFVDSGI